MNYSVFNSKPYPLYVTDSYANAYFNAVRVGTAYITTATTGAVLALANTFALKISNPSGSGRNILINNITVLGSGVNVLATVTIAKGATTLTNPVAPTTFANANLGLTTSNSVASITMSNQVANPGGTPIEVSTQVASVYTGAYVGGLLIPPNNALTVYVNNTLGVATTMFIKITFWEEAAV